MNENYWKEAYKDTWDTSSRREKWLVDYISSNTGMNCSLTGMGAGSSQFISGSAARNGYQKGDADILIEGTNIYIEVTGPLVTSVQPSAPLWFRPDKLKNAIVNAEHDVFLAHHCMSADLWRIIHIDTSFKQRFRSDEFRVVTPWIRGRKECYVEIVANDPCIRFLDYLVNYINEKKEMPSNG